MKRLDEYRIRWAKVFWNTSTGRLRMCIAERRTRLFWIIPIWLPVEHGNWRHTWEQANRDVAADIEFRHPLPPTTEITR